MAQLQTATLRLGEYRYSDIVTPDGMPAIVPQDIFDKAQVRMEKNKRKPAAIPSATSATMALAKKQVPL